MYSKVDVPVSSPEQKHSESFTTVLDTAVKAQKSLYNPLLFMIGSWQTGDFGHVYAAIVSNILSDSPRPVGLIILRSGGEPTGVLNDINFALAALCERRDVAVVAMVTSDVKKENAIKMLSKAGNPQAPLKLNNANVYDPYEATFMASGIVRAMRPGQPMTPVWADLSREGASAQSKAYALAVEKFTAEYLKKFTASTGREKFVCLWSRTSGMRMNPSRPTGGANPQYDSSDFSNHQLCVAIKKRITDLKCIFIVGPDGFADDTRALPYVFDLGAFWKKLDGVMGRFQENGFFDFMTAVYDCDVVHVGMKSGGMDVLGLWGQKVVFVDSVKSPKVTASRVGAWNNEALLVPVPVDRLPTPTGKAIDDIRGEKGDTAIRTSVSQTQWKDIDARTGPLEDGFTPTGLEMVVEQVARLF